tara:strand:- start:283 stop:771 length:489 start_codon:yes stop_codon:yes gene_type:complete
MAGIQDLLQKGILGDLMVQEPKVPSRQQILNKMFEENPDVDIAAFMNEVKAIDRKSYTPKYIYDKNYQKSPFSLFTDAYDPNSEYKLTKEQLEKQFKDYLNIFDSVREGKLELDNIFKSETLSPVGESLMNNLVNYKDRFGQVQPNSFEDLINMVAPISERI